MLLRYDEFRLQLQMMKLMKPLTLDMACLVSTVLSNLHVTLHELISTNDA